MNYRYPAFLAHSTARCDCTQSFSISVSTICIFTLICKCKEARLSQLRCPSRLPAGNARRLRRLGRLLNARRNRVFGLVFLAIRFLIGRLRKLTYVDAITLNATPSLAAKYFYRCNSLFDPDFTATGHQPMGFDQYAALYNHYHVHSAYIECIFSGPDNNASGAQEGHICAITLNNDTADARNLQSLLEDSSTVKTVIHGNGNNVARLTLGYNERKLSCRQAWGYPRSCHHQPIRSYVLGDSASSVRRNRPCSYQRSCNHYIPCRVLRTQGLRY